MANQLKFWRQERQLSQIELSSASSVPRHVIQLAEQGLQLPRQDQLEALAATLGVPVDHTVGRVENHTRNMEGTNEKNRHV